MEMLVQALAVSFHSSLKDEHKERLRAALASHSVDVRELSARQRKDWQQLHSVTLSLLAEPRQLRLRDLLVTWHGQRGMGKWANFQAGTQYLQEGKRSNRVGARRRRRC